MDYQILLAFILYFALVLGIGLYFYKRSHSMEDYFLGGRKMGPYVTAMSAQASDMSGWLLLGLPGSILVAGMGQVWIGIGLAIGSYISWLVVAKRLRKHSVVAGNSLTMPEFFSNRYKDTKGYLRLISSVVILVFFVLYVASGFKSCGEVLNYAFGVDITLAMIIGAAIILIYTFLGGYKAVCWTDFFQAILMVVAIVIVPIAAISSMGGWDAVTPGWEYVNMKYSMDGFTNLFYSDGAPMSAVAIISLLAWGFGYFGMPHIVVRYMSIRSIDEVKVARRISLVWIVIALAAACLIGLVGRAYFDAQGLTPSVDYNPEHAFLMMAGDLFIPFIAGVIFAAVMAAIMSTADSQLLVSSSSITNDVLGKSKRFNFSDEKLMWISRIVVMVIAVFAVFIALFGGKNIMGLVGYAWAGFGSAFAPLMILSLFWKRMNLQGAMAAMITGFIVVILWETFGPSEIYSLLPGFLISLVVGIVVALLTPEPPQEAVEEFDAAQTYTENTTE
ncbi:sodium/proline symporter PutP [Candidatus Methanoprimaticola sp. MG2]|uniref:sodium/proline symporter PutP n=1 Tax=Candidatus Methanoprimaticola sp. MG2 TaxID=3228838 RepID=UPI0039C6E082